MSRSRLHKMRTTSLRSAIFPITLSRASRWHDSNRRESGSEKSPSPKSASRQRRFAVSINFRVDGDVGLTPIFSNAAPDLFKARIRIGARVCSTVVGARIHRQLWQVRPKASFFRIWTRPVLGPLCSGAGARRLHQLHRVLGRSMLCFMTTEKATFGAGCFWGVEETFRQLKGVTSTAVGYAGGNKDNPSYEDVCSDETGHAEVVQVEFDPSQINYDQILDVFWSNHNPTTLNRQGPDVGTQYRSVIFYHSPEQKAAAEKSKQKIAESGKFNRPIVTQIEPAPKFWRAEEYHQRYLEKRGQSHCAI